ncbi:ABC transporter ATP-binding protein [Niabella drilacis]|uniref:Peptide/nickel transport system ATP-binding protein n=1 Tax=Niabella drilacis (strain DSM 25811 / CCM 8410 / CCUG 62505 / LMG 26954 / E90) TaxID=1285928 RepID=A0A1G6SNE1_NIADE|nr:ABC transporter ATP-binding protein [Niabella drilacis]SDD17635.1 peptide/nickel transport system ATP-binding protein [Niabella drilacis]
MQQPLLEIRDLCADFISDGVVNHALKDISVTVHANEIVALVGESGSGKSVTSLSVLQLIPSPPVKYVGGAICYYTEDGASISLLEQSREAMQTIRGNAISMIFQEPMSSLNPVYTCGNQVAEAIRVHTRVTKEAAKALAIRWFERVQLPDPPALYNRYPHQLSGGQKQRVMIAMAMCCKPRLLICDEPTTALDVTVQKTVLQLIRELQQETGMGVIFITHDLGVVAEIADRAVVLYRGGIVEEGTVRQLFSYPQHPYTKALLACRPVNHKKGTRLPVVSDFTDAAAMQPPAPAAVTVTAPEPFNAGACCLVSVEQLSVWYPKERNWLGKPLGYTKAVDAVSFEIFENETLGLVGESGCGKTTLGRALLQLIPSTSGKIIYRGQDMGLFKKEELRGLRKKLQIIFQDPYSSLNPRKKIGPAIEEPLKVHRIEPDAAARKKRVETLLEKVGLLPEHYHRYPHEFSGGQRQRIVIARALALNPSFIICDESVSALDVSVQAQVLNLLNDLKKEFGFTIVFISHDLSVVRYFSDRIIVMNKGKIEESGPADEIYEHPQSAYTQKLIASIPKGITPDLSGL